MASDRRQYPRIAVHPPVLVLLGITKVGFLFDLGEGGLSVHGLTPETQSEFHFVSFGLPDGECVIEARVELAWKSDSENRTGLRFIQVGDRSRRELREWIGVKSSAVAAGQAKPVAPVFNSRTSTDLPISPISTANVSLFPPTISSEAEPSKSATKAAARSSTAIDATGF